ncbi:Serine-threonine/tyrosine-protein kinase [Hirschfeldia incana]|nr:Serine-threonine/tyrosine-protein kinase [Hirschfeldia incana]
MGNKSYVLVLLCFLIISFSAISVSAQTCDETAGKFKPNSTYDVNRRILISTLPSNVTDHNGWFSGSIGLDPNRVYAMGMCSPGAELAVCNLCIKAASNDLLQSCTNQSGGFEWISDEHLCFVRYSSKSFSGVLALEPLTPFYNVRHIEKEDQKGFDSVWDGLMSRVITAASSSSLLPSFNSKFAKDTAPVPVYGNITVLMQCTPDVSSKNCKFCLEASVDYYKAYFHGNRGVILLRPSCFFRWELYYFLGAFDKINGQTPPPAPLLSLPPSPSPFVANLTKKTKKGNSFLYNLSEEFLFFWFCVVMFLWNWWFCADKGFSQGKIAATVIVIFVVIMLTVVGVVAILKRRKQKLEIELPPESVQFDFKTIEAATSNFSERNKLGEGGFGEVYKGMLMNGTEVAVKRLSKTSGQGEVEFKNEVIVVAKLQHRNLVRLLGFSLQGEDRLLVYEFVPNQSLDYFLFDPNKRVQLHWTVRRNIVLGITRGILYLHQDSRLTIIHRDLKASNILLDAHMNPKIADFGMARIIGVDQTVANTARVVGTFGYMSPEYVTHGQFSTKSDVYSFGVLILEIISGRKNSSFYQMTGLVNNLVTYVWRLWENKSSLELVDTGIKEECTSEEVIRYIHVGLLCVQENPADRPTLSTVHQMLTNSSITLPAPLAPGFFFGNKPRSNPLVDGLETAQSNSKSGACSIDKATITHVTPR